jgi:hypothetical protein
MQFSCTIKKLYKELHPYIEFLMTKKGGGGNAIPVTGHGGPHGCETLRLHQLLDSQLTDGGKVVSLTRLLPFYP